jgi:predicted RNA binding protein YcfA (HicA-like mRNA interferase family)
MKRNDLVRHLERHGCQLLREGGKHTIYVNRAANRTSTVPRPARSSGISGTAHAFF